MDREWVIPIVLGLVAGGITWLVPTPTPEGDGQAAGPAEGFTDGCGRRIPLLPAAGTPPGLTRYLAVGDAADIVAPVNLEVGTWDGSALHVGAYAFVDLVTGPPRPCAPSGGPGVTVHVSDAPTEERQNFTGDLVLLTLYIFDSDGLLLASNAPAAELAVWTLHGDYIPLSSGTWYLGEGAAPDGTLSLPFGAAIARDALSDLPVGAVASVHVVDHPYAWYVGDLWLTARIEGIA